MQLLPKLLPNYYQTTTKDECNYRGISPPIRGCIYPHVVQDVVQVQGISPYKISPFAFAGLVTENRQAYNLSKIISTVCEIFDVDPSAITTRARKSQVSEARFVCFHIMKACYGMTHAAIAKSMKLDRASVIHGLRVVNGRMEAYKDFALKIATIKATIR